MKAIIFLAVVCMLISTMAIAENGVVIDVKGSAHIVQGEKKVVARSGSKFSDKDIIEVKKGGLLTILLSSGVVKKIAGGERYEVSKGAPSGSDNKSPIISGIAMAFNDASRTDRGPVVHGMVKAAPSRLAQTEKRTSDSPLQGGQRREMMSDLNKLNALFLGNEGKAIMQAQVYYKYQQYQKMVNILIPVYRTQSPPSEMVKDLISLGFEKMGRTAEAAKYRD